VGWRKIKRQKNAIYAQLEANVPLGEVESPKRCAFLASDDARDIRVIELSAD
jgi:hypothetical protein